MTTKYFPLVLGLAMLPGCPLLDVQVEVSEVCLTYPDVQVSGVPAGTRMVDQSFAFDDLSPIHDLLDLDADLQFVRAQARVKSGIQDFRFVDAGHISIASGDPSSTLPTLPVYDCSGDCLGATGTTLELPAGAQQDAAEYAKGDSLIVNVDLLGQLPSESWTMDLDVCMKGHIGYSAAP